jgi:uncharacterized membrane-anchored protein
LTEAEREEAFVTRFRGLAAVVLWCLAAPRVARADGPSVKWVSGPGVVGLGSQAEIRLKAGHAFANAKDTQALMEAMGNTVSGQEVGLIRPETKDEDWILIFDYHDVGYVKDDEKDKIDKDALLKSISEGTEEANQRRKERGIPGLHVVGWYEEPHYDQKTHNLVWALRAKDDNGEEVVNYNMRVLGRPAKLALSKPVAEQTMQGFSYKSGKTYAEFRPGDKIAQYGLAALIAGGAGAAAVKLGLFAALWKFIAKGGKALVLLIIAAIAGLRRAIAAAFGRRGES